MPSVGAPVTRGAQPEVASGANGSSRGREILACAARLFGERGYSSITMDDVAAAAHITKKTLYRYFNSKEAVLYDIHELSLDRAFIDEHETLAGSPRQRLEEVITRAVHGVWEHHYELMVFHQDYKYLKQSKRAQVIGRRDQYEQKIAEIVAEGLRDRRLMTTDPAVAIKGLLGSMNQIYNWGSFLEEVDPETVTALYCRVFLDGILVSSHRPFIVSDSDVASSELPQQLVNGSKPKIRIVDAASRLFATKGYHATTGDEMAAAARMTKSALFYHVSTKNNLLREIVTSYATFEADVTGEAARSPGDPAQALAAIMIANCRLIAQFRDAVAIVNEELRYADADTAEFVIEQRTAVRRNYERALSAGNAVGYWSLDPRIAARLIQGMVTATYRWYQAKPDGHTPQEVAVDYARLIFHGLARPAA